MSNDPIKEARRILEDAGYGPAANPFFNDDDDHDCAAKAVWWLRRNDAEWERAAEKSRKLAEREAEDAKAKAYRYAIFPAAIPWEHLDEEAREAHRVKYRTARDYFAKEAQS